MTNLFKLSDQELNELVARKLGYVGEYQHCSDCHNWHWRTKDHCNVPEPTNYLDSIEAAWEILEEHHGDFYLERTNGHYRCELFIPSYQQFAYANTAPKAIVIAFLKLKEAKGE